MDIKLYKKPKNPIIIEGFPGFGLIGTITTEFLIDHLDTELIGKIWLNELPAMVAIHENKVVEPLGLFYNKKYNIVIVHGVTAVSGFEWDIADAISSVAKQLGAKEIISVEGVGSQAPAQSSRIFYYCSDSKCEVKFKKMKIDALKEGIIMGVAGAILIRAEGIAKSCVFAETHSNMPDSKASAGVIKVLDQYLGLEVDYKPLLQQAEKFEEKLKTLMQQTQETQTQAEKKKLSYVG